MSSCVALSHRAPSHDRNQALGIVRISCITCCLQCPCPAFAGQLLEAWSVSLVVLDECRVVADAVAPACIAAELVENRYLRSLYNFVRIDHDDWAMPGRVSLDTKQVITFDALPPTRFKGGLCQRYRHRDAIRCLAFARHWQQKIDKSSRSHVQSSPLR